MKLQDDIRYRLLKPLEAHPEISQRARAEALGVSLGRVNFCLRALIEKGLVEVANFRRSNHKLGYVYLLTPAGLADRIRVTRAFLAQKQSEYEAIQREIEQLRQELQQISDS